VGFGDPSGNYWLGNDRLSQLTANNHYKLRIDLQQDVTGKWYYAEYYTFRVLSEADNYELLVVGFSGNASSSALGWDHGGRKFSTYDRDNDPWLAGNCAAEIGGGFWYRSCGVCQLNGARSTGLFLQDSAAWRSRPAVESDVAAVQVVNITH